MPGRPLPAPTASRVAQPRGSWALGLLCLQTWLPRDPVCPRSFHPPRLISWDRPPWPRSTPRRHSAVCGPPSTHSEVPPPPQQHLGSLLKGTIGAQQEWATRRGSTGGARQEGEQAPQRPCLGRSPVLAGFCTLCALGGSPTSASPECQAVSAENWPRPQCSQTSVWERQADVRRPFPLLQLGFPPFCTLGLSPEPLPLPPHPSWRPTRAPRI